MENEEEQKKQPTEDSTPTPILTEEEAMQIMYGGRCSIDGKCTND
jgi:hypothetical protein